MKFVITLCVSILVLSASVAADCECGLERQILGGDSQKTNTYPWIARIKIEAGWSIFNCQGVLIDNKNIITSADCVTSGDSRTDPLYIYLGLHGNNYFGQGSLSYEKIWIHPQYSRGNNNIAVITLSNPVEFSSTVSPICLPNLDPSLSDLEVAGWARSVIFPYLADDITEIDFRIVGKETCEKALQDEDHGKADPFFIGDPDIRTVDETRICAIRQEAMGNACIQEIGVPLMHKSADGRWYLIGLDGLYETTSCKSGFGLYTRTSGFIKDIKNIASQACWRSL